MIPVTKEIAKEVLNPYMDRIRETMYRAVDEYKEKYLMYGHELKNRSKSSIIHDYVERHIRKEFGESMVGTLRGMFYLNINDKICLRFKKINSNLKSSNIRTQQTTLFDSQQTIPGIVPTALFVNAGYMVNSLYTDFNDLFIVCPDGDKIGWSLCISDKIMKIGTPIGTSSKKESEVEVRVKSNKKIKLGEAS
jgi:hypothetical protein